MDWMQIVALAKQTCKYIFVDCYVTWCLPCKHMDQNVFTQSEHASFMNSNFINCKLQFDNTDFDTEEIKVLYAKANRFKAVYSVNVYPTYLIFDNAGVLVHRNIGVREATSFLEKCKEVLNSEMQYESLIATLIKDRSNIVLNKKALDLAQKNRDLIRSKEVLESLENCVRIDVILTPEFIPYIINSARSSTSYAFNLINNHMDTFDRIYYLRK